MTELAGRIAVVTGGGRGLGRQTALALAERGARVAAVARTQAQLAETVAAAAGSSGEAIAIVADVSSVTDVQRVRDEVLTRLGPPQIVVNAAGVFGPIQLIRDSDPGQWVATLMIDAVAAYLVSRAFLNGMIDSGWGRIVSVTSAASLHTPGALNSAYATAKVALNQFTRHLAAELEGTGVTANVIHPGDVKTDMWADIRDRVAVMGPEAEPYRQWAAWVEETGGDPPHKAVDLILRLVGDEGAAINGQFNWVDDPLQKPIPSWGEPVATQPWRE